MMADTHTFTSIKPWCNPARIYVEKAFQPLGIEASYGRTIYDYTLPDGSKNHYPVKQYQNITVRMSQATWAEYVLGSLRSQTGITFGNLLDIDNHNNGAARNSVPMPWLYQDGGAPKDDLKSCVKLLPETKRKAALAEIEKSGGESVRSGGILFGHEGHRSSRPAKANKPAAAKAGGLRDAIVSVFSSGESSNQRKRARQTRRKSRR